MKTYRRFFIPIFLWLLIPCYAKYQEAPYESYAREITRGFIQQIEDELDLSCYGDSGMMSEDVEEIGLRFKTWRRANIEEARALIVFVTERLTQAINAHEKIRPYLREYPFPSSRVEISIAFHDLIDNRFADGTVARSSHISSDITYYEMDAFRDRSSELLEEPYEEALKIVEASSFEILPHQTTKQEAAIDDIFHTFSREMEEKYYARVWGIGCKKPEKLEEIGAKFTVFHRASQEQARALQILATERLLELVNTNEVLRDCLDPYPFTSDQIKMRLNFRNQRYTSYRDGTMESVTLENNEMTYLQRPIWKTGDDISNLDRPIILVGKESYEQALKIAQETPITMEAFKPTYKLPFWRRMLKSRST